MVCREERNNGHSRKSTHEKIQPEPLKPHREGGKEIQNRRAKQSKLPGERTVGC